ncbi:MAG: PorT family protein [Bacteroidales bacterium]|nr:PorT family protein [Bacteroidales bacterium]
MKKIILTLALAAVAAIGAHAQIGVGVGYTQKNFSDVFKNEGGLFVGANYNIELVNGLAVAPGIDFAMVSYKKDDLNYQKENYLAIPVMFNYAINLVDGFKLVPYLGPTFSYGISGKAKGGVSWGGITLSSDEYDVYETFDDYNRLDIMIGGGVALDVMDMIRVQIGYNLGLLNRNNDSDGTAIKTSGVNFGVAYLF